MCGCAGSTGRQQVARPAQRTEQPAAARPAVAYGDPGFVWTGPAGAVTDPQPEPEQQRR